MIARRVGAWLATALVMTLVAPADAGAAAPAIPRVTAGAKPDINAKGFEQLSDCLASGDRVDALYVVDVSGSLKSNDPDGRRFEALEASVAQIGRLASGADGLHVQAAVSTFGDSFSGPSSVQEWSSVDSRSAAEVASRFRARAELAWRDAGTSQGTNYEAALQGAQSVLTARGARSTACQVVFWFTDGLFALGDSYDEAATNAASRRMCRPGRLVDRMREQRISIIALALTGPDVDAQLAQPQYSDRRGELQAMAVGKSGAIGCGAAPAHPTSRSGIYLTADDPVGLAGLFSGVAAQTAGCSPQTLQAATPTRFRVQPGVNRFQVDTSVDGGGGEVTVTAPSGTGVRMSSGLRRLGDAEVRVMRTGSLATVTVALGARESSGMWIVDAGSRGRAVSVTLYRCSDLRLEIVEPDKQLAGGEPGIVEAVAVDSTGDPVNLTSYKGAAAADPVRVAVTSKPGAQASVKVADPAAGRLRIQLVPPKDTTSVELELELTPRLTDSPEVELGQVTAARRLAVTPPGSFPTVAPADLDLGRSIGLESTTRLLEVTGSEQGRARVCVHNARAIEAPAESGTNRIASSAECLDLKVGESAEIEVSVTPEISVDGEGRAKLPVTLINRDGKEIQQAVALTWRLERRVDQGTRMWLVAAAILLSLLLLALALAVVNRLLTRFGEGDVRFATVPVDIDAQGQVQSPEQGEEVRPEYVNIDKSQRRRLTEPSGSGIELRAKAPLTLGDPEFTAHAPTGARLVPSDGHVRGDARTTPVTAGLGAGWLLQVSDTDVLKADDEQCTPARLTVYGRGDVELLQRMIGRCSASLVENGWLQVLSELAERARATASLSGGSGAAASGDAMATQQPGVEPTNGSDDPFGNDRHGAMGDPVATELARTSRRRVGRSSRQSRNDGRPTPAHSSPLDEEDPFA